MGGSRHGGRPARARAAAFPALSRNASAVRRACTASPLRPTRESSRPPYGEGEVMRRSRWAMLLAAATGTALAWTAVLPAGPVAAHPVVRQAGASGPTVKLIALQHAITAYHVGNLVYIDPRVFVTAV